MDFNHELIDDKIYVRLSGNIIYEDTATLSQFLNELLSKNYEEAVLNLSQVTGITSNAIGAILEFYEKLSTSGRKMRINGLSEKAYTVLKYFKLDQVFPIER